MWVSAPIALPFQRYSMPEGLKGEENAKKAGKWFSAGSLGATYDSLWCDLIA